MIKINEYIEQKDLIWQTANGGWGLPNPDRVEAHIFNDQYYLIDICENKYTVSLGNNTAEDPYYSQYIDVGKFNTLEDAKDACVKHFIKLIVSLFKVQTND
jgi:hypothetical protein